MNAENAEQRALNAEEENTSLKAIVAAKTIYVEDLKMINKKVVNCGSLVKTVKALRSRPQKFKIKLKFHKDW